MSEENAAQQPQDKNIAVSESRVSQLHTQAVLRLKGRLRNNWDEFVALIG
jgi:DNA-directed RNA polymerase specialized sigma subunit